jgi:Family of unknown function (DUF6074)
LLQKGTKGVLIGQVGGRISGFILEIKRCAMKRDQVVPFPLARRRNLIEKIAAQMAARRPVAAEKHLQQQLRRQINVLHRRQMSDQIIDREVRAFESTVRAELWRLVLTPSLPPSGAA